MKIIHISDTHGAKQHEQLIIPECDVLLHTGDIGGRTTLLELQEFLEWFSKQPAKKKIFIAGNHDIILDKHFAQKLKNQNNIFEWSKHITQHVEALQLIKNYENNDVVYLADSEYVYNDIKFYGSPYSPSFHKDIWVFNADRGEEIKKIWGKIPSNTDVLLTHTPLYSILDDLKEYAREWEDTRAGCIDLLDVIKRRLLHLKLHCCGHIHDNYGVILHNISNSRRLLCSNGTILTNKYNVIINKPLIIEL